MRSLLACEVASETPSNQCQTTHLLLHGALEDEGPSLLRECHHKRKLILGDEVSKVRSSILAVCKRKPDSRFKTGSVIRRSTLWHIMRSL
jgi:hypothetical protein